MKLLQYTVLILFIFLSLPVFEGGSIFILDTVNFIFHEAGHPIFGIFGEFFHFIGGTLGQLFIPGILCSYFFFKREVFSSILMLWWFGQNLIGIGVYAADAEKQELELFGGGLHDWTYILDRIGALQYSESVGVGFHVIGLIIMFIAVGAAFFVVNKKHQPKGGVST